ncbi:hypothetical protein ACTXKY_13685 [Corynebacterium variabile]|uniref:hypothetical protein n=1 Tax=Corynebacterium variabile TaxID=1727 RepID=UPI003FCFD798
MKTHLLTFAFTAATALVVAPSAYAEPDFIHIYERTGTVTESNPFGVPEFDDLAELGNWSRGNYADYAGHWWELRDYMKSNCARHINYTDTFTWYNDPVNVENVDNPYGEGTRWQSGVKILHHYPAKTAEQCATENGTPTAPAATGSISGSLVNLGL